MLDEFLVIGDTVDFIVDAMIHFIWVHFCLLVAASKWRPSLTSLIEMTSDECDTKPYMVSGSARTAVCPYFSPVDNWMHDVGLQ